MLRIGAFAIAPTDAQVAALLEAQRRLPPTFKSLGASLRRDEVEGYRTDHRSIPIGDDPSTWNDAVEAIRSWQPHRGAGLRVHPDDALIEPGTTVIVTAGVAVRMIASCRVTQLVHEPNRYGFVYATLPLHPEEGEEAFTVERDGDGSVRFAIDVVWRPRDPISRLGGPLTRRVQREATTRYLRAMRDHVRPART